MVKNDLTVKSKLPPQSGSSLVAVEPHPKKEAKKFYVILTDNRYF